MRHSARRDRRRRTHSLSATIYNSNANFCILDSNNSNFIMDSWHSELGNVSSQRGKSWPITTINMKEMNASGSTGVTAFVSRATGKPMYIYYMPASMFDWRLLIFAEDADIRPLMYSRKVLMMAGAIGVLLLMICFMWNISPCAIGKKQRRNRKPEGAA